MKLINTLTLILAILLIDLFWIAEDYWFRWFGLVGFGLMGWYWRQ